MKYWIYKDSRIQGPYDKDTFAGLPGVDAYTLVCTESSPASGEGGWHPAGELPELAGLELSQHWAWSPEAPPSTSSLLDKLQIDAAGLIADDEFPRAAEDLFQDADLKKTFGEMISARPNVNDAELRRTKDRVSELTVQLELIYKRVAELEAGRTELVHRLAEKELLLRRQAQAPAPVALQVPPAPAAVPAPVAVPVPVSEPIAPAAQPAVQESAAPSPVSAPPPEAPLASDVPIWVPPTIPQAEVAGAATDFAWIPIPVPQAEIVPPVLAPAVPESPAPETLPDREVTVPEIKILAPSPAPVEGPTPASPAPAVEISAAPLPSVDAPSIRESAGLEIDLSPVEAPAPPPSAPALDLAALVRDVPDAAPAAPAKTLIFDKPKRHKVVPTLRSFRVVDKAAVSETEAAPLDVKEEPVNAEPVAAAEPAAIPTPSSVPTPPISSSSVITMTFGEDAQGEAAPSLPPAPVLPPPPAAAASAPLPPVPSAPPAVPPAAPIVSAPVEEVNRKPDAIVSVDVVPLDTAVFGVPPASPPSTQDVLARLAKPEPVRTTPPRPPRSHKKFLMLGAMLVFFLAAASYYFLRQPKELKQMASLDDGRERMGVASGDDASSGGAARTPTAGAPSPSATAGGQPAGQSALPATGIPSPDMAAAQAQRDAQRDAAIAMVKEFPLDGGRGTIGQWLQYSYSATPGAGQEVWNGSETSDKTYLVEYRFVPSVRGGPDVHYLFEVDKEQGFVVGKNLDAQRMLSGGSARGAKAKPKAKPKRKPSSTAARKGRGSRAATRARSRQAPPANQDELRPPSEENGAAPGSSEPSL